MKSVTKMVLMSVVFGIIGCGCGDVVTEKANTVKNENVQFNTIGVYVVIDYSGSMSDGVLNGNNQAEAKCDIVKRSLISMGKKFDSYLKSNGNVDILSGFVLMRGSRVIVEENALLKNGVEAKFNDWINEYLNCSPDGGTPLGNAIQMAYDQMKPMNIKSKNVIVLTDGESNAGDSPETVMRRLNSESTNGVTVGVHFVAIDVNSACFNGVKSLGATVLGASNEKELNEKINVILKEKILLEKED